MSIYKVISILIVLALSLGMVGAATARTDDPREPAGKAYPPPELVRPKYLPEVFAAPTPTVESRHSLGGWNPPDRNEPGNGGGDWRVPWVATPIPYPAP